MTAARTGIAALIVAVAASAAGPAPRAQGPDDGNPREFMTDRGKARVFVPDATSRGAWPGTWMYKSRDFYIALWLRPVGDGLEAKLQFMGVTTPESFETDWRGKTEYYVAGERASFSLDLGDVTPDRFRGKWVWEVEFTDSGRSEVGTFEAFRSDDGLHLNIVWDELARTLRRHDQERTLVAAPVWTFRKVSTRLILWDEVPF